ncbi:MAG: hypothetical protein GX440_06650 [Propionibacterium sp.]|nr:hypothetical protein [Propionibacterium sp.]
MSGVLAAPFPEIGERMMSAYDHLFRAQVAKRPSEVIDLGPLNLLPRPWDLATITMPALRAEVWQWLDAVAGWLNREYMWETSDLIPPCWPSHPHLVHELGVVADQRRRAGLAFTSDALEEWHRYCLPSFVERMKARCRGFCEGGHLSAPGCARNIRYEAGSAVADRKALFADDIASVGGAASSARLTQPVARPCFQLIDGMLVDTETGEIADGPDS